MYNHNTDNLRTGFAADLIHREGVRCVKHPEGNTYSLLDGTPAQVGAGVLRAIEDAAEGWGYYGYVLEQHPFAGQAGEPSGESGGVSGYRECG